MTSQEHADHQLAGFHAAKAGVPFSHHESDAWREGYIIASPTAAQAFQTATLGMDAAARALPKSRQYTRCTPSFGPVNNGADREHSTYWGKP